LTITSPVTVTAPVADEILKARVKYTITWRIDGSFPTLDKIDLLYTTDATANPIVWTPIKAGLRKTTRSFSWTPPNVNSTNCQIKVVLKDSSRAVLYNGYSGIFTITR
jgi:hypothetical protein